MIETQLNGTLIIKRKIIDKYEDIYDIIYKCTTTSTIFQSQGFSITDALENLAIQIDTTSTFTKD